MTDPETGAPRTPSPFVPLTVEDLFAKVEEAIDRDAAASSRSRYDPELGYPHGDRHRLHRATPSTTRSTYTATDLVPAR